MTTRIEMTLSDDTPEFVTSIRCVIERKSYDRTIHELEFPSREPVRTEEAVRAILCRAFAS